MYKIHAVLSGEKEDGGTVSGHQLPTFYVNEEIQGLQNEEHAEKVARIIVLQASESFGWDKDRVEVHMTVTREDWCPPGCLTHPSGFYETKINELKEERDEAREEAFRAREALNEIRDEWDATQVRYISIRRDLEAKLAHFRQAHRECAEQRLDLNLEVERLTHQIKGMFQALNFAGDRDDKSDEWLEGFQAAINAINEWTHDE